MRMWMVDPTKMCSQHLRGEHVELHMFVSCIKAGKRLDGYLALGELAPNKIKERHDNVVAELARRGGAHHTPIEQPPTDVAGCVNVSDNELVLRERCGACRARMG